MRMRRIAVAVLAPTVGLLGLVPAAQAEVRVSPNYRLNSDSAPFRGQDQVGLAVNPGNPQHVVAVHANYLDLTCDASASFDGGATWSPSFRLQPPPPTGVLRAFAKGCSNTVGASQYVEFGSGQNVYTAAAAQRESTGFLEDASALLYKSTDGGRTWQAGVVAMQGGAGGIDPNVTPGPIWYRPSVAVDRGAGANNADRVHIVARDMRTAPSPTKAVVSEDGGQTFSAPVNVSPPSTSTGDFPSKPVVNPDHSVTVAWRTVAVEGLIQVARWNPTSRQWGAPVDVTRVKNTGTATTTHVPPNPPTLIQPGATSTAGSYPRMAGNPVTGRLYLVYSQGVGGPTAPAGGYQGADHFISPDSQVWLQRSSDNGATWSNPKRISEQTAFPGSLTHQTRHPSVSVSQNGRVNVVWHDRRHWYQGRGERNCTHSHIFCEDIRLGDTYYSYSTDGGDTFSAPIRITDRSHNNEVGYDTRPSGYWWFGPQSVTVGGDKVLIGWMDSREGNWDTDTEDIYLAKVDFNATGAAPQTSIDQPDAVSRSVALSRVGYQGGTEGALVGGPRDPAGPGPGGPATRNASAVVIASESDVAGALAGTVLARANPAPVLLSRASGLPAGVKAEVSRMSPARAFVIGDEGKLSATVISDLTAAGVPAGQITRLSGAGDAATAALIAARMDDRLAVEKAADSEAFDAAVIANPASPDAAAVAGLAAARRLPVLYVNRDSIPSETQAALTALDIKKTLVIGGPSSVSETVRTQLEALVGSAKRLGGADPYEVSAAVVAESKERGLPTNVVYAADGSKPMDAVLLGGVVARATGMLVLARTPLYSTAAGRASDVGLSGISRFFLLGPPAPGAARQPAATSPSYPGPPGPVAAFAGCPSLTANVIRGTAAQNRITGTPAADRIFAGAGNDVVDGLADNDCIDLGTGADRGRGGRGNDLMHGRSGKDRMTGSSGKDRIAGGSGADRIKAGGGNDRLTGGAGRDRLSGGAGRDRLSGGAGRDRLTGGAGRDRLTGGAGNDRIAARDGKRDRVTCGRGRDTAIVDRGDRVSRSCERVHRRRSRG